MKYIELKLSIDLDTMLLDRHLVTSVITHIHRSVGNSIALGFPNYVQFCESVAPSIGDTIRVFSDDSETLETLLNYDQFKYLLIDGVTLVSNITDVPSCVTWGRYINDHSKSDRVKPSYIKRALLRMKEKGNTPTVGSLFEKFKHYDDLGLRPEEISTKLQIKNNNPHISHVSQSLQKRGDLVTTSYISIKLVKNQPECSKISGNFDTFGLSSNVKYKGSLPLF
jgi:CRISPR-associated endoribonuclease Cas6/Csy4 subtype I-F